MMIKNKSWLLGLFFKTIVRKNCQLEGTKQLGVRVDRSCEIVPINLSSLFSDNYPSIKLFKNIGYDH